MEKLQAYQGWGGRYHEWRDNMRLRYSSWREEHPETVIELVKRNIREQNSAQAAAAADRPGGGSDEDYSHVFRPKARAELIRVSSAVMGIEFSYAAETAFVSPTLLKIGVEHQHMTLVWALSPLVGFFLTPVLGSLSDKCRLPLGRRRPFIILLSLGVFLGLLLVPNGEDIGYALGDFYAGDDNWVNGSTTSNVTIAKVGRMMTSAATSGLAIGEGNQITPHPWGIFFTILGTVLLDFDADACQSPARAYLLDVTVPEDHAKGLSTFTIMAGLGGFMGYSLGGINWDETQIGIMLGGHVRAVFTLVTFIFIICVSITITSFREIPLWKLEALANATKATQKEYAEIDSSQSKDVRSTSYGSLHQTAETTLDHANEDNTQDAAGRAPSDLTLNLEDIAQPIEDSSASLSHYLLSILHMPHSMRMVCLTNLFCWMAHVCYSLYFTDFVGESVFGGDPTAPKGSVEQTRYEDGVRFGCWGMAMYSLSCACYSLVIERLIKMFRAKNVYVGGLLFYCLGMTLMALTRARLSVIVFSWAAGVMYSTLFTMPYLLVAHYHSHGTFEINAAGEAITGTEVRGLGTDIAIVSSMVFLAQFILSLCMGTIVTWSGTTTAVVSVASFLSFCGAISATQIMYLDL